MLTPSDIRKKAAGKYRAYLKAWLAGRDFFPLEMRFAKIKSSDDYVHVKQSLTTLLAAAKAATGSGYSVTLKTRNTRRYGAQSFPTRIAFETEVDFLSFIGKKRAAAAFKRDVGLIRQTLPHLEAWLQRKPQRVIASAGEWIDLLKVCHYFLAHPRPNCYLRELPVAVHTKFIETHKSILRELLNELLPISAIRPAESHFERRFYLRYDEALVRLRVLDTALQSRLALPFTDVSVPLSEFAALNWANISIIITENKMSFLTLPALPNAIGIWGGGFEVNILKTAQWLADCPILYWGDLDAQGVQILAQLRGAFPHVVSIMMDETTWRAFKQFKIPGTPCPVTDLSHLTSLEQQLFERLATGNIRLEQERIAQTFVVQQLRRGISLQAITTL